MASRKGVSDEGSMETSEEESGNETEGARRREAFLGWRQGRNNEERSESEQTDGERSSLNHGSYWGGSQGLVRREANSKAYAAERVEKVSKKA